MDSARKVQDIKGTLNSLIICEESGSCHELLDEMQIQQSRNSLRAGSGRLRITKAERYSKTGGARAAGVCTFLGKKKDSKKKKNTNREWRRGGREFECKSNIEHQPLEAGWRTTAAFRIRLSQLPLRRLSPLFHSIPTDNGYETMGKSSSSSKIPQVLFARVR